LLKENARIAETFLNIRDDGINNGFRAGLHEDYTRFIFAPEFYSETQQPPLIGKWWLRKTHSG